MRTSTIVLLLLGASIFSVNGIQTQKGKFLSNLAQSHSQDDGEVSPDAVEEAPADSEPVLVAEAPAEDLVPTFTGNPLFLQALADLEASFAKLKASIFNEDEEFEIPAFDIRPAAEPETPSAPAEPEASEAPAEEPVEAPVQEEAAPADSEEVPPEEPEA